MTTKSPSRAHILPNHNEIGMDSLTAKYISLNFPTLCCSWFSPHYFHLLHHSTTGLSHNKIFPEHVLDYFQHSINSSSVHSLCTPHISWRSTYKFLS